MSTRPNRVVVIAASPRTGSNLVCAALIAATGERREWHEQLAVLWEQMENGELPWRALTLKGAVRRLVRLAQRRPAWRHVASRHLRKRWLRSRLVGLTDGQIGLDGTFFIKVMWGHYYHLLLRAGLDAQMWGAPVTWVHLRRRDVVRQAVSWLRAIQSRVWIHGRHEPLPVEYDERRLVGLEQQARREDAQWTNYFTEQCISPLTVEYEDLLADYQGTMSRIFAHCGYPGHRVPDPPLERQADEITDEWVARFLASRMDAS